MPPAYADLLDTLRGADRSPGDAPFLAERVDGRGVLFFERDSQLIRYDLELPPPSNARNLAHLNAPLRSLCFRDGLLAYSTAGSIGVLDLGRGGRAVFDTTFPADGSVHAGGIWVDSGKAYVALRNSGLAVVDLATRRWARYANIPGEIREVSTLGGLIYAANNGCGCVQALAIDGDSLRIAASFEVRGYTAKLVPAGGSLFILSKGTPYADLRIIDAAPGALPRLAGEGTYDRVNDIEWRDTTLLMLRHESVFRVDRSFYKSPEDTMPRLETLWEAPHLQGDPGSYFEYGYKMASLGDTLIFLVRPLLGAESRTLIALVDSPRPIGLRKPGPHGPRRTPARRIFRADGRKVSARAAGSAGIAVAPPR